MPEPKWVWDYELRSLGSFPSDYTGHNVSTLVLTLDDIEAWLNSQRKTWRGDADDFEWCGGYNDAVAALLAQVEAWKAGA